jgi:hypothetical protein
MQLNCTKDICNEQYYERNNTMKLMSNGGSDLLKVSAKEFATLAGVDYAAGRGFMNLLVAQGLATEDPTKRPNPTGKGRATTLYNVPAQLSFCFDNTDAVAPVEAPQTEVAAAPQVSQVAPVTEVTENPAQAA